MTHEPTFITPREADRLLRWPQGRAAKAAREGRLPAITLPDGEIRFDMEKLLRFLNRSEKGAGRGGNAIARQARQAAGAACSDARILLARPPLHK
jgi:hypothetical protein